MNVETLDAGLSTAAASRSTGRALDRWIYVFMAALFLVTTLVGFVPDSIAKLQAIGQGRRPPFGWIVHVHAVLMGAWLLLLLVQSILNATGRRKLHRLVGVSSLLLIPAILAAMVGITFAMWRLAYGPPPPGFALERITQVRSGLANILLEQIRGFILFAVFAIWALLARNKDSESHKRLWVLATLMVLSASIDRLHWLPTTLPGSFDSQHAYVLVWLSPALLADIVQRGRPHRAYLIGLGLVLPFFLVSHFLWNSRWWLNLAPRLMGYES